MSVLEFGGDPARMAVRLQTGGDFDATMTYAEDWPTGTAFSIVFADGTTWDATVSGSAATFHADADDADKIGDSTTVKLVYTSGDAEQVWAIGSVARDR